MHLNTNAQHFILNCVLLAVKYFSSINIKQVALKLLNTNLLFKIKTIRYLIVIRIK